MQSARWTPQLYFIIFIIEIDYTVICNTGTRDDQKVLQPKCLFYKERFIKIRVTFLQSTSPLSLYILASSFSTFKSIQHTQKRVCYERTALARSWMFEKGLPEIPYFIFGRARSRTEQDLVSQVNEVTLEYLPLKCHFLSCFVRMHCHDEATAENHCDFLQLQPSFVALEVTQFPCNTLQ